VNELTLNNQQLTKELNEVQLNIIKTKTNFENVLKEKHTEFESIVHKLQSEINTLNQLKSNEQAELNLKLINQHK